MTTVLRWGGGAVLVQRLGRRPLWASPSYPHSFPGLKGCKGGSLRLAYGEVWLEWRTVDAGCFSRIHFPILGLVASKIITHR